MTITFYTNNSDYNVINKNITPIGSLTGTLRVETDLLNPTILFTDLTENLLSNVNYIYITEFNRYYFVNNFTYVRNNAYEIKCHCDVLMSFKEQILEQTAVIARQENEWNLYLDDGIFKVYNNPMVYTKEFPNSFNNQSFILAVAGANT